MKFKFLKKSAIRHESLKFMLKISEMWYKMNKENEIDGVHEKILISTLDALGDSVIKQESIKRIIEHYGRDNVEILCRKQWEFLFKGLVKDDNFHVDDVNGSTLKRAKLYGKLNNKKYHEILFFEFGGDSPSLELLSRDGKKIFYVAYPKNFKIIKNKLKKQDLSKGMDKTQEYIMESVENEHILELQKRALKKLIRKDYTLSELRGNTETFSHVKISEEILGKLALKNQDYIAFGIGAASRLRMMPVEQIGDIILYIEEKFKNKKLVLLGTGKRQEKYTKELFEKFKLGKKNNIINLVNKLEIQETFILIKNSYFVVGFDSGIGNIAFVMNKKLISFQVKENWSWEHGKYSNVATIIGDGKEPYPSDTYGDKKLNSIKIKDIENGLIKLDLI